MELAFVIKSIDLETLLALSIKVTCSFQVKYSST